MEAKARKNKNDIKNGVPEQELERKGAGDQTDNASGKKQSRSKTHDTAEELKKVRKEKDKMEEELSMYRQKADNLEIKLEEAEDKYIRLFSEFDNYRKRTARERQDLLNTAAGNAVEAILPVLDDLERAGRFIAGEETHKDIKAGINLIYQKLKGILKQQGVEEIPAEGQAFDTDYHEAVTHVPASSEEQKGMVVEELLRGYMIHGKVLRYARVVVAN